MIYIRIYQVVWTIGLFLFIVDDDNDIRKDTVTEVVSVVVLVLNACY